MTSPTESHHVPPRPSQPPAQALAQLLKEQWRLVEEHPERREAFGKNIGLLVPYSGNVDPRIEELSSGHCRVSMADRPEIRNHLNSIHAVALMNLAELASGLVVLYSCPDDCRSIIIGLSIRYRKKARGTITADCKWDPPGKLVKSEQVLDVTLTDSTGETVATAQSSWLIGPAGAPS